MNTTGEQLKEEGMNRALDNANWATEGWGDSALSYLIACPMTKFLAEDIRIWAHNNGLVKPPHARAWGGVIVRAKKEGLIKFVGYSKVKNPTAHATPASVWEKIT